MVILGGYMPSVGALMVAQVFILVQILHYAIVGIGEIADKEDYLCGYVEEEIDRQVRANGVNSPHLYKHDNTCAVAPDMSLWMLGFALLFSCCNLGTYWAAYVSTPAEHRLKVASAQPQEIEVL